MKTVPDHAELQLRIFGRRGEGLPEDLEAHLFDDHGVELEKSRVRVGKTVHGVDQGSALFEGRNILGASRTGMTVEIRRGDKTIGDLKLVMKDFKREYFPPGFFELPSRGSRGYFYRHGFYRYELKKEMIVDVNKYSD